MAANKDLNKQCLYEAVKELVESEASHIHLPQHKLFTLFCIAFQYFLFTSTKRPGHYILRLEDSFLAEKLIYKAKDETSRKFMEKLLLPRRLRYGQSTFHLDFFHPGSWAQTNMLPKDKVIGALIVKNTVNTPVQEASEDNDTPLLPPDWFYTSLVSFVPKTIIIAYGQDFKDTVQISFPFIKKERERLDGVTIADNIDLDE